MRVAWLTDIHLNFVPYRDRLAFYARLRETRADGFLIGGDIGESASVSEFLKEMESEISAPIWFVLGNHDFYRGSIAGTRLRTERQTSESARLHWLSSSGVVHLTEHSALIGHDSWADGRLGNYQDSEVVLNDYVLIEEFRGLTKEKRLPTLHRLGEEAADYLEAQARLALARHSEVIVLTHVPPFREACWHEGRVSGSDFLPHFACGAVGERLAAVMRGHPEAKMTILCGHTHSGGSVDIGANLQVLTGASEYGSPAIQCIFEFP